jgi:hypothetical protein
MGKWKLNASMIVDKAINRHLILLKLEKNTPLIQASIGLLVRNWFLINP